MSATSIRLGVATVVWEPRRGHTRSFLMGKRGKEPNLGKWVIPGGKIEPGETWKQAAAREIKEETSLDIDILPIPPHVLEIIEGEEHRVILFVQGQSREGQSPVAGSDLLEAKFVPRDELDKLDISEPVRRALREMSLFFSWPPPIGVQR